MSVGSLEIFFSNATQYYICGRFAVFAGLSPVGGNLLHHGVEMYLKGSLSKNMTLASLKSFNHGLQDIWNEFKTHFQDPVLTQFDSVIMSLHSFEELRYPDSVLANGMLCTVSIKHHSATIEASDGSDTPPQYDLCIEEIDKLVATIFRVASVDPKFFLVGLKESAKQWLQEQNVEKMLITG